MIFALFPRVAVKLGPGERHIFDRATLMFTEVQEIEKVTGLSFAEWQDGLNRGSITSVAALIHILRRRAGTPSDYKSMQFAADDLDYVPVHPDDREYTRAELAAEISRLLDIANNGVGPTPAAAGLAAAPEETAPTTASTNPSSPNGSTSAPGNGSSSRTRTGSGAKRT
jgi:hypothetical protein